MPVYAFNAVIKRVKIRSRQLFGACFIGAARLSYLTSATKGLALKIGARFLLYN